MKEWSNLAKIIYKRTYSRVQEDGSSESWENTVERVIDGNIGKYRGTPLLEDNEEARLKYYLLNRKATPAGRGLWLSGTETQRIVGGLGLTNCAAFTLEDIYTLVDLADYLMLGAGVGISVEHRFVSKIPKVKKDVLIEHKNTKDADFIIPDSREGWCQLTAKLIKSFFFTGKSFTYSTICVRGMGEPIKGFGGIAAGPLPLIEYVDKFHKILKDREGKHIRPIDALDLVCAVGEMVVAGNIRRSAIIILGDSWDKEYLKAKRWDLGNIPSQRAMANLSVVCDDVDDLHPLFWETYKQGEPFGIINRSTIQKFGRAGEKKKDSAILCNPCQPAWATVLTKDGIRRLGQVTAGDYIWSETGWTKILNKWSTGVKPVFDYQTTAGYFQGTENHKLISFGEKIEAKSCDAIDVLRGNNLLDVGLQANHQAIIDGLVIGDGSIHLTSKEKIYLTIGENDQDYFDSEIKEYILGRHAVKFNAYKVKTNLTVKDLPKLPIRTIPYKYFKGEPDVVVAFLRGLYSANGSICGNRITLKATSFELIRQVQLMLNSLGILSYYTSNKSKKVEFSNGIYLCKNSYDLNITSDRKKFQNTIGFIQRYKTEKLNEACKILSRRSNKRTYDIIDIKYLGDFEVWDITVDNESHTYWTGGLNVSNCAELVLEHGEICNLQEIFLPNLTSIDEFKEAARLFHRWGKRVSNEPYHLELTDKIVKRNRRIGTGITGCMQSDLFKPEILDEVYQVIQKENKDYAKLMGVPESIRTTTIKPSGTLSLIGECTPGIHPAFSKYYIRTVRFATNDPLVEVLKEAGYSVEFVEKFDGTLNRRTVVVDFYCKTPDGTPCADEDFDMWKQLEVLQIAQKYWADNAVSVTIYYKREDLDKLKEWLKENIKNLKTISFLCYNDHGFKQAPYQAITEEEYLKGSAKIKPIDFDKIGQGELESLECENGSCPIK